MAPPRAQPTLAIICQGRLVRIKMDEHDPQVSQGQQPVVTIAPLLVCSTPLTLLKDLPRADTHALAHTHLLVCMHLHACTCTQPFSCNQNMGLASRRFRTSRLHFALLVRILQKLPSHVNNKNNMLACTVASKLSRHQS